MTELRRQLKPLRQQAEMAKKHETLTAQAEELSRKLAAARLRGLLAERDRRSSGWDEGLDATAGGPRPAGCAGRRGAGRRRCPGRRGSPARRVELRFRDAQADRAEAEQAFRSALDRESASATGSSRPRRAARPGSTRSRRSSRASRRTWNGRVEELAERERELDEAETAFRDADQHRREVDELRRRAGEEAVGRRVEIEALERAISSGEREGDRLEAELARGPGAASPASGPKREEIEADIEGLDGQTSPLAERRTQLEDERRRAIGEGGGARRHRAPPAVAPRAPGGAPARHRGDGGFPLPEDPSRAGGRRAEGSRASRGRSRAGARSRPWGRSPTRSSTRTGSTRSPRRPRATARSSRSPPGGPVTQGLSGERPLLSAVDADPAARGIVSTVLRDVYLAGSIEEAAEKQDAHPGASFVTPDGTLVGPAVIHTPKEIDTRAREIRAELQVLAHDLAGTRSRLKPQRQRMDETSRGDRVPEPADRGRRRRHHDRRGAPRRDRARPRRRPARRRSCSPSGSVACATRRRAARGRLAELGPAGPDDDPGAAAAPAASGAGAGGGRDPPAGSRIARRAAGAAAQRSGTTRSAHDPQQLRAELEEAEAARAAAEQAAAGAEERATAAAEERDAAATAERAAASARSRDQQGVARGVDRARQAPRDLRGGRPAPRATSSGGSATPSACCAKDTGSSRRSALAMLTDDDSVPSLEKASELVQRRLGLLGRVNLLATGEFEVGPGAARLHAARARRHQEGTSGPPRARGPGRP